MSDATATDTAAASPKRRGRPPKAPEQRDDGNRRLELIRAAAKLFRRKGFDATSTRDIAAAVGMHSGSPFYHFKSKLALLHAVMEEGMRGAISRAEQILASDPSRYVLLQQFKNPANPAIHFKTTGPEILVDTEGKVDIFIAGVGTGGTISGVSRYLKLEKKLPVKSIAVEPSASPVLAGGPRGKHKIQGIGAGFVPDNFDRSVVDEILAVTDDEAFEMARRIAREEGITCGISCGAAMAGAIKVAERPESRGKTIVVILPDSGERYLSTPLYQF